MCVCFTRPSSLPSGISENSETSVSGNYFTLHRWDPRWCMYMCARVFQGAMDCIANLNVPNVQSEYLLSHFNYDAISTTTFYYWQLHQYVDCYLLLFLLYLFLYRLVDSRVCACVCVCPSHRYIVNELQIYWDNHLICIYEEGCIRSIWFVKDCVNVHVCVCMWPIFHYFFLLSFPSFFPFLPVCKNQLQRKYICRGSHALQWCSICCITEYVWRHFSTIFSSALKVIVWKS